MTVTGPLTATERRSVKGKRSAEGTNRLDDNKKCSTFQKKRVFYFSNRCYRHTKVPVIVKTACKNKIYIYEEKGYKFLVSKNKFNM